MTVKQIKYLLSLNRKRRKIALAKILLWQLNLFDQALKINDKKKKLEFLAEKIDQFVFYEAPEGQSKISVMGDDLIRLFEIEEQLDDLEWEIKEVKRLIEKLEKDLLEKISSL